MPTALFLVLLAAAPARAGLAEDRDQWFRMYEKSTPLVAMWAQGVADALAVAAISGDCRTYIPVSGTALAAATADYLRQDTALMPITAAILVFERLSRCRTQPR